MRILRGLDCHNANSPHDLEALKRLFVKQFITFSNVNCNKCPVISLKEFRHVSQRGADLLNIFYDGEYNITIFDQ
jgi:hypothetical protein